MMDRVPDIKPPSQVDPRIIVAVAMGAVICYIVYTMDQVAFVRPPANQLENLMGIMPVILFKLTGDRLYTSGFCFLILGGIVMIVSLKLFQLFEEKVAWPALMKKRARQVRIEQELANKYDSDAL